MDLKKRVAVEVTRYLEHEFHQVQRLGIGSGTTVRSFLSFVPEKLLESVELIPTSVDTLLILRDMGFSANIREPDGRTIDLTIDGADKISKSGWVIKGGGGALTREKIVRLHSREFWVMVDESKLINECSLTSCTIPVEILPFGHQATIRLLEDIFPVKATLRMLDQRKIGPVVTDNGNYIVDLEILRDSLDLLTVEKEIKKIPGVIESGIFASLPYDRAFMACKDGTVEVWSP